MYGLIPFWLLCTLAVLVLSGLGILTFAASTLSIFLGSSLATVVGLAVIVVTRLSTDLWVYTIPSTVLLIGAENLNSMERYSLSVFPLVIAAAVISRRTVLDRWLPTASAVALVSVTTLALNGVYVP